MWWVSLDFKQFLFLWLHLTCCLPAVCVLPAKSAVFVCLILTACHQVLPSINCLFTNLLPVASSCELMSFYLKSHKIHPLGDIHATLHFFTHFVYRNILMILFFLPVFACYAYFCCYTVLRKLYLSGSIAFVGSSFGFLNIQWERTGNSVDMRVYITTENTGQTLWNAEVSAWSLVGNECFSSSNNTLRNWNAQTPTHRWRSRQGSGLIKSWSGSSSTEAKHCNSHEKGSFSPKHTHTHTSENS